MAKKISYNVRLLPARVAIGLKLRKRTTRKTKLPSYIEAMIKSSIAWTIMIRHVLAPLTRFILRNKSMLNKKESSKIGSFDFTYSLRPASLILTKKALGTASRLSRLMKNLFGGLPNKKSTSTQLESYGQDQKDISWLRKSLE